MAYPLFSKVWDWIITLGAKKWPPPRVNSINSKRSLASFYHELVPISMIIITATLQPANFNDNYQPNVFFKIKRKAKDQSIGQPTEPYQIKKHITVSKADLFKMIRLTAFFFFL
jgi:hypothetical protein